MSQDEGQSEEATVQRYVIVELRGTKEDADDVVSAIEACGRPGLSTVTYVHVFGCNNCGCQAYFPEVESCEDELCGHECPDDCQCVPF
jgi:hypothetical protein